MTEFDYGVLERKRLARNAKYRKNGSKSKKCTLPCDHMTAAQKKGMNGPMVTYNLGSPVRYSEFKYWPEDVQYEYLKTLWDTFRANKTDIAKMLGISGNALGLYLKRHNLSNAIGSHAGYQMPKEARQYWEDFVKGEKQVSECRAEMQGEKAAPEKPEVKPTDSEIDIDGLNQTLMKMVRASSLAECSEILPCETNVATEIKLAFPGSMDISQLTEMLEKALSSFDVQEYRITCQCCLKL